MSAIKYKRILNNSSGGGSGVTSVTGTAGRITSTGGATPVLDIDSAYDNKIVSSIYFTDNGGGITPLDSTTYYVGATQLAVTTTENTIRRFHFAKACTIVGCEVTIKNLGVAGTSESSIVFIRLNNTTNYNISTTMVTTVQSPAVNFTNSDSLNIPIVAGDFIIPGWTTPAWVTNPGLCVITFLLKVKY